MTPSTRNSPRMCLTLGSRRWVKPNGRTTLKATDGTSKATDRTSQTTDSTSNATDSTSTATDSTSNYTDSTSKASSRRCCVAFTFASGAGKAGRKYDLRGDGVPEEVESLLGTIEATERSPVLSRAKGGGGGDNLPSWSVSSSEEPATSVSVVFMFLLCRFFFNVDKKKSHTHTKNSQVPLCCVL